MPVTAGDREDQRASRHRGHHPARRDRLAMRQRVHHEAVPGPGRVSLGEAAGTERAGLRDDGRPVRDRRCPVPSPSR
jgi:hypothetical protein